jgi:glycopeptide antibiotics resistance protein
VHTPPSRRARIAFALWVGVILFIVVPWYRIQDHSHWARVGLVPFMTPEVRVRDVIANTFLYVPFGYLYYRVVDRHAGRAVIAACLLSLATELTQVYSHGRFPSATDLFSNTVGGWLGAVWAQRAVSGTTRRRP